MAKRPFDPQHAWIELRRRVQVGCDGYAQGILGFMDGWSKAVRKQANEKYEGGDQTVVQTPSYGSNDTQFPLPKLELANGAPDRPARAAVPDLGRDDKRAGGA